MLETSRYTRSVVTSYRKLVLDLLEEVEFSDADHIMDSNMKLDDYTVAKLEYMKV